MEKHEMETLKEGTWYIKGCEELEEYFDKNDINFQGDFSTHGYYIENGEWDCNIIEHLQHRTELTYSQFLDMMGESEEVLQVENKPFDREFILCASLKFHDNIVSGHRHSDCYELIRKMCPNITDTSLPQREDQGFLTSLNRHVDRREGWKIAKENNQIKWGLNASDDNEESQLISENLY